MDAGKLKLQRTEALGADVPFYGDSMSKPTIFVDAIRGFTLHDGVVRMHLVENRIDMADDAALKAVHVATLAMSLPQFAAWAEFFPNVLDQLKEAGAFTAQDQ